MTLKDKLENIDIVTYDSIDGQYYFNLNKEEVNEIVNITEEFAIGFANWVIDYKQFNKSKNTKELLEIYKKEKGL